MHKRHDWNYRLVRYFLDHRQLTILLLLVIVLGGIFGISRLRVEGFPQVPIPIVLITTALPGAGPETIANTVTSPLEVELSDLKGLREINSISQNNISTIVLAFEHDFNAESIVPQIRAKLDIVKLPQGAGQASLELPSIGGAPFIIAVTGHEDFDKLLNAGEELKREFGKLKGIERVQKLSPLEAKIVIELAGQFQTPQIQAQIQQTATSFPVGHIVVNGKELGISGAKSIASLEELKNLPISIPIAQTSRRRIMRLQDIASIKTEFDYGNQIHRAGYRLDEGFKMRGAVLYQAHIRTDTDLLEIGPKIQETLAQLQNRADGSISFATIFNQAEQAQMQVDELLSGAFGSKFDFGGPLGNIGYIFGGMWLLVIVLLIFIDWRSALVSLIAIPLSFLFTFLILGILNIQLNTVVLFSLVLVLGLIVDPAIVVLEVMRRYLELGHKRHKAALESADAIGQGVFVAVLTSLMVFIPFAVVSGIFGEIIRFIPLAVIPALIGSYFVPLVFLTWLSIKFFKRQVAVELKNEDDPYTLWPIAQKLIRINRAILNQKFLQIVMVVGGVLIPLIVVVVLFKSGGVRQVQFSQPDDVEFIAIRTPLDAGISNSQRFNQSQQLEKVLEPFLKYFRFAFYGSFENGFADDSLALTVQLTPLSERELISKEIASQIDQKVREIFGQRAYARQLGAGPPQEAFGVKVQIFHPNEEILLNAQRKIAEKLRSFSEVAAVQFTGERITQELRIAVLPDKAAQLNISPAVVLGQLNTIFGESELFFLEGKKVVLRQNAAQKPQTADALGKVRIATAGGFVPLSNIARVEVKQVPGAITKLNGERFAAVSARIEDARDTFKMQRDIDAWVKDNLNVLGLTPEAVAERGIGNEFKQSFQELFIAIYASLIASYIIFVLFFRSFLQPLIVLFSVPLILIGAVPAVAIFSTGQFGFLETIGLLILIGLVENVGIFMVDYANRKVETGMDKKEAIALASGIRFRPIFLTKITLFMGLIPLAVFSPFWRGLSVVVIAGIITAGLPSLFVAPILYSWLTRRRIPPEINVKSPIASATAQPPATQATLLDPQTKKEIDELVANLASHRLEVD